jgi:hypothetical protein
MVLAFATRLASRSSQIIYKIVLLKVSNITGMAVIVTNPMTFMISGLVPRLLMSLLIISLLKHKDIADRRFNTNSKVNIKNRSNTSIVSLSFCLAKTNFLAYAAGKFAKVFYV